MARATRKTRKSAVLNAIPPSALGFAKATLERARAARGVAHERAARAVSRLESVFEDRVSRVVAKLGVPTSRDVRELSRQVAELRANVQALRRARARA
jgi:poly(hydroxyalkanoate) granule-associated protein